MRWDLLQGLIKYPILFYLSKFDQKVKCTITNEQLKVIDNLDFRDSEQSRFKNYTTLAWPFLVYVGFRALTAAYN